VAGTIALNLRRPAEARRQFAAALERDSRDTYALLELGSLTANAGDRRHGAALLARARALDPRDPASAAALRDVRAGRRENLEALNSGILTISRRNLRPR
jgi:hypothetical protein